MFCQRQHHLFDEAPIVLIINFIGVLCGHRVRKIYKRQNSMGHWFRSRQDDTDEKKDVVDALDAHGVFLLKGIVSEVAPSLDVSEQTIYRYLK